MKLIKYLSACAAAVIAAAMMTISAFAAEVWTGSQDVGTDWDGSKVVMIDASQFADVKEGDTVTIYFDEYPADYWNVKIVANTDGWPALTAPVVNAWGSVEPGGGATSYSFNLNAADAESLKNFGMVLQGYGVIYNKVDVGGEAPAAETTAVAETEAPVVEAESDPDEGVMAIANEPDEVEETVDEVVEAEPEPAEAEAAPAETEAAPAETAAETTPAPAADSNSTPAKTGNAAASGLAAASVLAAAAAIFTRKK